MNLQQNAGIFSPLVSPQNSTTWYMFATPKLAVSIYSQPLRKLPKFLKSTGDHFFFAFSIHEKHQAYDSSDLSGAIFRVSRCLQVFEQNVTSTWELNCRLPLSLNGPEGSVAAKTGESVRKLLKWRLD